MNIIFLLLILQQLNIFLCAKIEFDFRLAPHQRYCFDEEYAERTLYAVQMNQKNDLEFKFVIEDDQNTVIYQKIHEQYKNHTLSYSSTTFDGAHLSFCMENQDNYQENQYTFILKSGTDAKDYSKVYQQDEKNEINLNIKKIKDILLELQLGSDYIHDFNQNIHELQLQVLEYIIFGSTLTIITSCMLAVIFGCFFNKFFHYKKLT